LLRTADGLPIAPPDPLAHRWDHQLRHDQHKDGGDEPKANDQREFSEL
jgi:hypothetical protein